jgi:solute carrier family 25 protein 34/35
MTSVIFGVTAMQPVDVIRTRLYNQPFDEFGRGKLYKSAMDTAMQIVTKESPFALFKGWTAHYLRGAPHVTLIFLILEQLKKHRPLG